MQNTGSSTITFDEVDRILHGALETAKEVHRRARKAAWIASTLPLSGEPQIERSSGVQSASMQELLRAAERYGDFLMYGKIPDDLKLGKLTMRAGK
jgi:hypothetical protein